MSTIGHAVDAAENQKGKGAEVKNNAKK